MGLKFEAYVNESDHTTGPIYTRVVPKQRQAAKVVGVAWDACCYSPGSKHRYCRGRGCGGNAHLDSVPPHKRMSTLHHSAVMMKDDIELVKREVSYQESQPVSSSRSRERSRIRNENTVGILRLEPIRPRRSSGSPVKFRTPSKLSAQGCAEPVSPQPSVDRLSVTFAAEAPSVISMDKVRFESNKVPPEAEEEEEEEDYSQSVSAIFQRKASTRRSHKRRRSSSPKFVGEVDEGQNSARLRNRRRSSVFTTSSGDTAISVEDAVQEQILQNIKLHKEVLSSVKQQPWNMRRKLRLVRQAKAYIRRHEGELQERLAQSRSTRDILARFNIVIIRHWQHTKRELANLMNVLIPWEIRIKEIESHFGSVVASYFTFLRWLFWVNLVTAVILIVFVAVPEMVMSNPEKSGMRKKMLEHEEANATNLFTLWDFDGVFKYSPLFYGYYSHRDPEPNSLAKKINYSMPLAYFITELVVYIYSFVAILRRMAENSRQSKLSEKDDECVFTWKLFTGWDYMIGNAETAHNRTASIILGFKEALLEEAEKKRDEGRNWKVTSLRVFAHMNVVWLLGSSVYAVILVVQRSTEVEEHHGWWRKNEITIVVSLITSLFPVFFEVFGIIEQYHPRKKLRMQLARIMALNLLNIYTLIFASFSKINEMSDLLEKMRENVTRPVANGPLHQDGGQFHDYLTAISPSTWDQNFSSTPEWYKDCKNITIPCSMTSTVGVQLILGISVFTSNLSTFTTSESMDGQFSSISSTSSLSTDSFTQNYQVFRNSNTVSENISYFNTSTINFIPENVTLSAEVMNEENDTLLTDFVGSELYNFIPANNHSESDLSEFDNYVFGMDSNNITNFNNSEEDSLNKTGAESTTDIISTLQFITFSTDSDSATEIDNQTSPPDPFVTSINDEITSSSNPESTFEEEKCVVLQCETVTKPLLKPTVPTSYVTDPNHASATSTQFTTTTIGSHDSGYPSHRWSKSVPYPKREDLTPYISSLDMETRKKLVPLCWETMFGREMVKLTVMDLVMTVISTLMVDFFRAVFVRFMNNCWCWDLEKKFPQYGDFKIAENILHLVNNQGMVWMGMFFSPGLPLINVIKLAIMMYLRSWAVLTCNVPHEVVFRASRSNNFYLALLLTMLFLCVLPVGYAVVWVVPSWHCGPFSTYHRIYHIFTSSLKKGLPYDWLHKAFDYIASPSIVIPLLMLLVLIIYYLISLTSALREANNDLKIQLRRERTEERRKMFQLVDKKIQEAENPSLKWKKALPNFPYGKLSIADIPIDLLKVGAINGTANYESAQKELIEEFMKKAKRMPSGTSEEENALVDAGDGTDAEQHDSLPYDVAKHPKYSELIVKKDGAVKKLPKDEESKKRNGKKKISKEKHSSSKEGDGSENSGWSEIPEIRIIQTESTERLDDVDNQSLGYTPNEIKASKVKNNKPKSGSLQQKVKKRHEKKTRNEKEEIMSLESVAVHVSPKHSKKVHKQKKRSSSKTDGESSIDTAGSGNENYEDGSFSESSKKGADKISAEKSKLFKLKTAVNASQALRNKGKDAKKKHSDRNNGDKKTRTNKRKISNSEESSEQKLSKLNLKGDNGDQETTLEPSHDSGDDSHAKYTESDYDSEKYEDEKQRRDQLNSSSEEKSGDSKSESDEELSNSDENGNDSSNSESKTSTKQLKKQSNSTESDASSQNTVKQVNFSKQKKENKKVLESDRNNEERESKTQTPKENKTSKKAMARFKIANVLLKEARRRSSSGLEEK